MKIIENQEFVEQEKETADTYERFAFGKHSGKLVTIITHIEYKDDSVNKGFLTSIISKGVQFGNNLKSISDGSDKIAKDVANKFGFTYGNHKFEYKNEF